MPKWEKKTLKLRDDHQWEGTPGHLVFVADRGALRFEVPEDWVIIPGEDAIKFYDKQPPDDDCLLQASVIHLHPQIDWRRLPLEEMHRDCTVDPDGTTLSRGDSITYKLGDLTVTWYERVFVDEKEQREARERSCFAHKETIIALITFAYWPEDAARVTPVWNHVLASLRLGEYISDPTRGDRLRRG